VVIRETGEQFTEKTPMGALAKVSFWRKRKGGVSDAGLLGRINEPYTQRGSDAFPKRPEVE